MDLMFFNINSSEIEEIKINYTEDSNLLYNQKNCEDLNTSQFNTDEFETKFIEDNGDK